MAVRLRGMEKKSLRTRRRREKDKILKKKKGLNQPGRGRKR